MKAAFIFDLNGTMIDDMAYHIEGWFDILNTDLGAGLSYEQVKGHMYGKNSELLERVFGKDRFTEQEIHDLSMEKERRYQSAYRPHLRLVKGLADFLAKAKQHNIPMGIGSAAIPFNVDFVLDGLGIRDYFGAVVTASDVHESKPHPETFLKAAELLGMEPKDCIVFEDAPKGVEAAAAAGMRCVVLTTMHSTGEFGRYANVQQFITDYTDPWLNTLFP